MGVAFFHGIGDDKTRDSGELPDRKEGETYEEKTKSGIILSSAAQEKPQFASVVAVGPGGVVDGKEVKMYVSVGDKVIASKYAGTQVKIDGEEYTIVNQSDILATLE